MNIGTGRTAPLLALTAVVLAAHVWLLRSPPGAVQAPAPANGRPFIMRTVAVAPVADTMPVVPAPAPPEPAPLRPANKPARTLAPATAPAPEATAIAQAAPQAPPPGPARAASTPASRDTGAPAMAFAIAGPVRLLYKVQLQARGLTLQGAGELLWRHDGGTYEARLQLSAPLVPTRTQHSSGRITAEGLAPQRFSEKGRSEEAAHFERDKGRVSFSSNRPDAPLLAGAQDRLSVLLQLGAMIAGEPAKFPAGTAVTIQTAGARDAEPWVFTVEGQEALQLPGGSVGALKLTRSPRKEFDTKVELWLAPSMDYVPVRLRLTQPNGDSVDQQWSSTDRG